MREILAPEWPEKYNKIARSVLKKMIKFSDYFRNGTCLTYIEYDSKELIIYVKPEAYLQAKAFMASVNPIKERGPHETHL